MDENSGEQEPPLSCQSDPKRWSRLRIVRSDQVGRGQSFVTANDRSRHSHCSPAHTASEDSGLMRPKGHRQTEDGQTKRVVPRKVLANLKEVSRGRRDFGDNIALAIETRRNIQTQQSIKLLPLPSFQKTLSALEPSCFASAVGGRWAAAGSRSTNARIMLGSIVRAKVFPAEICSKSKIVSFAVSSVKSAAKIAQF
jgi:hypothetical protein